MAKTVGKLPPMPKITPHIKTKEEYTQGGAYISPERMHRFSYSSEELDALKCYPSTEAWVEESKKKGLKVHLY